MVIAELSPTQLRHDTPQNVGLAYLYTAIKVFANEGNMY